METYGFKVFPGLDGDWPSEIGAYIDIVTPVFHESGAISVAFHIDGSFKKTGVRKDEDVGIYDSVVFSRNRFDGYPGGGKHNVNGSTGISPDSRASADIQ